MPTPQTGHPDWQPINSTPVTVLVESITGLPTSTWGPVTVNVSSGGAYMLSLSPGTGGSLAITDILVEHLDPNGNVVHSDFYGAVISGSNNATNISLGAPTICRGNIYGSQLIISGQVGTGSFQNSIFGLSGLGAVSPNILVYVIPNTLADPEPKVYNGKPLNSSGVAVTAGNVLYSTINQALAHGVSGPVIPLLPYAGPAVFALLEAGVITTPTNLGFTILGYSVMGGTTPVTHMAFAATVAAAPSVYGINIPSLLNTIQIVNSDAAQNATIWASIIASASD